MRGAWGQRAHFCLLGPQRMGDATVGPASAVSRVCGYRGRAGARTGGLVPGVRAQHRECAGRRRAQRVARGLHGRRGVAARRGRRGAGVPAAAAVVGGRQCGGQHVGAAHAAAAQHVRHEGAAVARRAVAAARQRRRLLRCRGGGGALRPQSSLQDRLDERFLRHLSQLCLAEVIDPRRRGDDEGARRQGEHPSTAQAGLLRHSSATICAAFLISCRLQPHSLRRALRAGTHEYIEGSFF